MPRDDEMLEILKILAPGTKLREGLDNILKAKTGALVVISEAEEVMKEVSDETNLELSIIDYIAGMTDKYAMQIFNNFQEF